jgi:hypothetical protein
VLIPPGQPLVKQDITDEVKWLAQKQTDVSRWGLWPFNLARSRLESGSVHWTLEFRPMWKFALAVSFFWKAPPK